MARKKKPTAEPEDAPLAEEIAARLTADTPRRHAIPSDQFVSFGVTQLNLALSRRPTCGIPRGTYVYFVGDSSSGKTWFAFQLLAEAARNRRFDEYRFIHDNAENGSLMDVPRYFGQSVLDRLEPPARDADDNPLNSRTVQEFYFNLDAALDRGPCIYILDSMDAINSLEDEERFEEGRTAFEKARDKGTEPEAQKGTYGMAKAKMNSQNINRVVQRLAETGSMLFVISQTRDNVGGGPYGPKKTHSGGKALKFYSHVQIWTSLKGTITADVEVEGAKKKEREIGRTLQLDIQKNRLSGWEGAITVPFYRGLGIDDLGACVDYLIDEGHWEKVSAEFAKQVEKEKKQKLRVGAYYALEFGFAGFRNQLIDKILELQAEREVQEIVGTLWNRIEDACTPNRRSPYA